MNTEEFINKIYYDSIPTGSPEPPPNLSLVVPYAFLQEMTEGEALLLSYLMRHRDKVRWDRQTLADSQLIEAHEFYGTPSFKAPGDCCSGNWFTCHSRHIEKYLGFPRHKQVRLFNSLRKKKFIETKCILQPGRRYIKITYRPTKQQRKQK